jgi:hypothetical protein
MDRNINAFFNGAGDVHLSKVERSEGAAHVRDFMASHARSSACEEHPVVAVLRDAARRCGLTDDEKEGIGERLKSFVRFHRPDGASRPFVDDAAGIVDQINLTLSSLSLRKLPVIAGAMLMIAAGGTGVSSAARGALPGDRLYALKVTVIENPVVNLRFATSARADWEEELAERRLEEAERLAVEGRLTDEVRSELSARYERHAKAVRTYKGDAAVPDFETSLDGREAVLRSLVEERGEKDVQLRVVLDRLQQAKRETTNPTPPAPSGTSVGQTASSGAAATPEEAQRQIDAAARRVGQVAGYVGEEDAASAATLEAARQRLTQATNNLAQANAKLAAGAADEAANLAKKASLLAQEAKLLVRAEADLKVDLLEEIKE